MRRELAAIFIEIGFGVVFLALPYWIPSMPDWMIYSSSGLGVVLILVGFVMFFWKPKRQEKQESLQPNNNRYENSSIIGHDLTGDITYGDKLVNSIKDSFNTNNTNVPKPAEIAFQIWTEISKFQTQFKSIKYTSPLRARYDKYVVAKGLLDNTVRELLPQAKFVFEKSKQVSNEIEKLDKLVNSFGSELSYYESLEEQRLSWGRGREKPPPELLDEMEKTRNKLWNDEGLEFHINTLITELLDLLRQEKDKR